MHEVFSMVINMIEGKKKRLVWFLYSVSLPTGKCLIIRTNIVKITVRLATDCVTA
jgi:hypothetical protein